MIVVAAASPLRYPVLIGHARVLPALYGRILIPPAVDFELSRERTPVAVREWLSERPEWLEIQAPQPHRRQEIPATLGQGKREAIALAEEVRADALLIDDLDARREASRRGLPVVGTLRVPADAGASDLLDLAEAVARLQATNFRVDPELLRPVIGGLPPSQER